ncbi:MAG: TonB-dependent receptor [Bacteroidia bacterium]
MRNFFILFFSLVCSLSGFAQNATLTGSVKDETNQPLSGASVSNGSAGAYTEDDGTYSIELPAGTHEIQVMYLGYATQKQSITVAAGDKATLDFSMKPEISKTADVIIVGSRVAPRSSTTTPLPVDVVSTKDLKITGQNSFDKTLQYKIPSFNTVQTPVNDATSLLDPYEIRNMGPSRTLILINGKRKNMSSLLYTQTSPGRGETGADISAIPVDAIKRVEILRDGASAQYGSDAIAGVMNIILKDNAEDGGVTLRTGITGKGDGAMAGIAINNGSKLGKNGFINYTLDFSKVGLANRPGTVDAEGEASDFGANIDTVKAFLAKHPDAGNVNGSPATTAAKFNVNMGSNISATTEVYGNAAYVYKKVNSFANYRTPYWRQQSDYPYLLDFFGKNGKYEGYVPTFDGDLSDYNATAGFRTHKGDWIVDGSFTTGGNQQLYTVTNSHNRSGIKNPDVYLGDLNSDSVVNVNEIVVGGNKYQENSPTSFRAGGTSFSHQVGNIDISRRINERIGIAFGSEFRTETFNVIEGDLASYEGGGADSYAGNSKENSFRSNRYNLGGYLDAAFDITEDLLLNGTVRYENYSDFGGAFVWKASGRYKLLDDKYTIRASASTGFRAPSLHQIYTQKAQYSFVPGQGIQVGGLVNNTSKEAHLLGVPSLTPEKSTNITVGVGLRPTTNLSITVDYYNIGVKDRIVLSNRIQRTQAGNTPLDAVLNSNNISDVSFFVNAIDTRTSGIDLVATYRNIEIGSGKMMVNLSGNYMLQNERVGEVKNPKLIADAGQSVINQTQEALFFTSRPKFKAILGLDYEIKKFSVSLNNTLFGPTQFRQDGLDENLRVDFLTKVVSDLAFSYQATEKLSFTFNANNFLNVLPEWKFVALNADGEKILADAAATKVQSNLITFNQRYSQMTYDGYHFSQLGRMFSLSAFVKF